MSILALHAGIPSFSIMFSALISHTNMNLSTYGRPLGGDLCFINENGI
jgi:hypothetical protein